MRLLFAVTAGLLLTVGPTSVSAQDSLPDTTLPSAPDDSAPGEGLTVLSADQQAQMSLGGFRDYLERVREDEPSLYTLLDVRLDPLEERETIADVIFWTGTALSAGALLSAIPVNDALGLDASLAFVAAGAGTFLLTLIIQTILRPGHDDLMVLIDMHDQRLGRR